ncbi:hypothetical protein D9M68_973590 [compost metagenome]
MCRQLHIVLCIAQVAEHGQAEIGDVVGELIGGAGADVDPHAEHADIMLVRLGGKALQEILRRQDIEHRGLQRYYHFVGDAQHLLQL